MSRRRTDALVKLAVALLTDQFGRHYGYELMQATYLRSGTLYPLLDRMLHDGWVTDDWDLPGETESKKPRRYYTLTDLGRRELSAVEHDARLDARFGYLFGGAALT